MSLTAVTAVAPVPQVATPAPASAPASAPPAAPAAAADTVKISPQAQQASADVDHDGDRH